MKHFATIVVRRKSQTAPSISVGWIAFTQFIIEKRKIIRMILTRKFVIMTVNCLTLRLFVCSGWLQGFHVRRLRTLWKWTFSRFVYCFPITSHIRRQTIQLSSVDKTTRTLPKDTSPIRATLSRNQFIKLSSQQYSKLPEGTRLFADLKLKKTWERELNS